MEFAPSAAGPAMMTLAAAVIDNLAKVPFSIALAPMRPWLPCAASRSRRSWCSSATPVLRISQSRFDLSVLAAAALAGSALLLVQERERGAQMAAYSTT